MYLQQWTAMLQSVTVLYLYKNIAIMKNKWYVYNNIWAGNIRVIQIYLKEVKWITVTYGSATGEVIPTKANTQVLTMFRKDCCNWTL